MTGASSGPSSRPSSGRRNKLGWLIERSRHEAMLVVALLVVSLGALAFAEIADLVVEGETHHFDRTVLLALRNPRNPDQPLGPPWFQVMMRDFTGLGGTGVLSLLTIAVVIYLWLAEKRRAALFVTLAILGGLALDTALKDVFERPRPELVPHGTYVSSPSFPSGHAMMSTVVYLTTGMLLASVQPRRRLKVFLIVTSIVVALIVGVSRVYLGVHWPTDVLAGWAGGAAWAVLSWLIAVWMQRRGRIEKDRERSPAPRGTR